MVYFDRIDVFEEMDINKTNDLRGCIVCCHYNYFFSVNFKFLAKLCYDCHDLMQQAMGCFEVAIFLQKKNDNRIYFWNKSQDEGIN